MPIQAGHRSGCSAPRARMSPVERAPAKGGKRSFNERSQSQSLQLPSTRQLSGLSLSSNDVAFLEAQEVEGMRFRRVCHRSARGHSCLPSAQRPPAHAGRRQGSTGGRIGGSGRAQASRSRSVRSSFPFVVRCTMRRFSGLSAWQNPSTEPKRRFAGDRPAACGAGRRGGSGSREYWAGPPDGSGCAGSPSALELLAALELNGRSGEDVKLAKPHSGKRLRCFSSLERGRRSPACRRVIAVTSAIGERGNLPRGRRATDV